MKKYLVLGLLVAVVLLAVFWRLSLVLSDSQQKSKPKKEPVVSVTQVRRGDLNESFQSVGTVESPQKVQLSPKVSGRVEMLNVHPGDRVTKGQVLVRLDPGALMDTVNSKRAQLAEAQARLASARLTQVSADATINTSLRQQKAALATAQADLNQVVQTSDASVCSAKTEASNSKAEADNAQVKLDRMEELYRQAFTSAQDVDDARTQALVASGKYQAALENLRACQARAQADVAVSQAKLTQAQAAFDNAKAAVVETSAYQQNLSALEAVVSAAKADLDSAHSQLNDVVLTSPLDGYVTQRFLDQGGFAKATEPVLTLQAIEELWINVTVPGEVRDKITEASPVTVEVENMAPVKSQILRINAVADPEDRQFLVRVLLPDSIGARPGLFARVYLTTSQRNDALVLPKSCLLGNKGDNFVFVVDNEKQAHKKKVTPGLATPLEIQILEGVNIGEAVVKLGQGNLEDGQTVKVDVSSSDLDEHLKDLFSEDKEKDKNKDNKNNKDNFAKDRSNK